MACLEEQQVQSALSVYLERGEKAINAIRDARWENADDLLKMRKAAFHNFRALDFLLMQKVRVKSGEHTEKCQQLWLEIERVNRILYFEMMGMRKELHQDLVYLQRNKTKIGKFRSCTTMEPNFHREA